MADLREIASGAGITEAPSNKDEESGFSPEMVRRQHTVRSMVPRRQAIQRFWDRFSGKGRRKIGWLESSTMIAKSSWLNLLLVFVPLSWISHFLHWWPGLTFAFSFLAIIPLERLFEYGGEQMAMYCGKDLGDLVTVTLNNAVEATMGLILLKKCALELLQSTITGVIILHLLLIPGAGFITGGARIWEQELHPHLTQLNQSLLTIGVMSLLLPTAFFAALDRAVAVPITPPLMSDLSRSNFLKLSRGLSIILLIVYVCSRIFLHNPPGQQSLTDRHDTPEGLKHEEKRLKEAIPEISSWTCLVMLFITVGILAPTAEWLVDSVDLVRERGSIREQWFGLILLPIVSFSADGAITIGFFFRSLVSATPPPPVTIAKARAIDLSIQFTLFWMPFLVLLGWMTNKPMMLLFDLFQVALLGGSCFLVNYVTADAKTNWAEGVILVSFYFMIGTCAWYYPGQPDFSLMLQCESVSDAIAAAAGGGIAKA